MLGVWGCCPKRFICHCEESFLEKGDEAISVQPLFLNGNSNFSHLWKFIIPLTPFRKGGIEGFEIASLRSQ